MTSLGKWRDHYGYFNECRNNLVNEITSETNNLIIRLDKLINHFSTDESSKKEFEKSVVPWLEDSEYSNCRVCNAKFSLTRRRHHCRLCGKIVCHNCSQFLSYTLARKLTGPEYVDDGGTMSSEDGGGQRDSLSKAGPSEKSSLSLLPNESFHFMRNRTGRILGSLMGSRDNVNTSSSGSNGGGEKPTERLRICEACKHLLERREQAMDLRTSQFIFVDIYKSLFQLLTEISNLAPTYRHMAESLNSGKTVFSLGSAIELRRKMISIQREIGSLSERIEKWGLSEEVDDPLITTKPTIREILLQKNIKICAVNLLHELTSTLPELPTQESYDKLVNDNHKAQQADGLSLIPECTDDEMDVMRQQYLNIKSFLLQAAQAGRLEEVEILEQNLLNIESEIKRRNLLSSP